MCNFYRGGKKVAILLAVLLTGCSPKVVRTEVPVPITNTTHSEVVKVVRDTVRLHTRDSVFVLQKGDTVYYHHYNTIVEHGSTLRIDTVIKNDTISKPVTVTKTEIKEVEKPLTRWQKIKMRLGGWCLALLALALLGAGMYGILKVKKIIR